MQHSFRGLLYVRMTETIGLGVADAADGTVPTRYFDRSGEEISPSQWEILRSDAAYQQLHITNITGLTADGRLIFIRIHTVWTGIGLVCGPPCSNRHIFETRTFDYFDFLPGLCGWTYDMTIPWSWDTASEAAEGHDAIVREILPWVPQAQTHRDLTLSPTLDVRELYVQRLV